MSSFRIDVTFPVFSSELKAALKKHRNLKSDLIECFTRMEADPKAGDRMPRVGSNVFKIRVGMKGQFGRRGGYRLIYHVDFDRCVITALALYFKPDTAKLPDSEVQARIVRVRKPVSAREPKADPRSD